MGGAKVKGEMGSRQTDISHFDVVVGPFVE